MSRNRTNGPVTVLLFQSSDAPSYQTVYDGEGTIRNPIGWVAIVTKVKTVCRLGVNVDNGMLACKEYIGEHPPVKGKSRKSLRRLVMPEGQIVLYLNPISKWPKICPTES